MSSVGEILAGYGELQAGQEAFYKDLHQHPELSHQEHRRLHPVSRTKTQGNPVCVDSPWIDLKISVICMEVAPASRRLCQS